MATNEFLTNMTSLRQLSLSLSASLVVVLCLVLAAHSFDRSIQQYVHMAWGEKDGAPAGILALAQTTDGYLWAGSIDGLYQFDGASFQRYRPQAVYALLARPNGDLWIGGQSTIALLRGGNERVYSADDGVPNATVVHLAADAEGTVWASTQAGLMHLEGNRWVQVGRDWGLPGKIALGICLDHHGILWVATENTIVFLQPGAHRFQTTGVTTSRLDGIVEAPNGRLWLIGADGFVKPMPLQAGLRPSDKAELLFGTRAIIFDHEGALWITTEGRGLRRIPRPEELDAHVYQEPKDTFESFGTRQGLTDNVVRAILQDSEGNIWVGTNSGLDSFRKGRLAPVVPPFATVQTLLTPASAGRMWITSFDHMVETWGDDKFTTIRPGDLYNPTEPYFYAYRSPGGVVWWSTERAIYRLKEGKLARIPLPTIRPKSLWPPMITGDSGGVLWAAIQDEGILYMTRDATWRHLDTPPEIAKFTPTVAYTDPMGRVWFGFSGSGIVMIEAGKLHVLATPANSPVGRVLITIHGRARGVWLGGTKLVYFDGTLFHEMRPFDGDAFRVLGVNETPDGSLWLDEVRGVIHIPSSEVLRFLNDCSYHVQYELYTSADGLAGSSREPSSLSREVEGTDGRLWFTATKGVAWLDPAEASRNTVPPPVSIRSLEGDGKLYKPSANLELPPQSTNLKLSYTALSLSVPSRVRFRYRLEGIDTNWQDPGTRREAFYTRLPPGKYHFRVIACNNDGVWNNEGATLDFRIPPAWFQTIWFRILCLAAALTMMWSIYRLRLRQIATSISARFDERLAERTRIARELHDTLLQTIQGSKLVASNALKNADDPVRTRRALEQLSEWLVRATDEGRAALHSLRTSTIETNDLAAGLRRALEDCRREPSMETVFSVNGNTREMHPIVRDEIYLIGYEAIRNAHAHSAGSRVDATLTYADDLSLSVHDNGIGIDSVVAETGKDGHFGLPSMRERAARIGGRLTIETSANHGTKIKIVIPGSLAFRRPRPSPLDKVKTIFDWGNKN